MVQSVHRVFELLELVAREPEVPQHLGALAEAAHLPAPTAARLLETLCELDYVEQIGRKKGYRLGIKSFRLGARGTYCRDLVQASEVVLRELSLRVKEPSGVSVLRNGKRFIVSSADSDQAIGVKMSQLTEQPVYGAATGRLMLAYMSQEDRDAFVRKYGGPTEEELPGVSDVAELEPHFADIRKRGYEIHITPKDVVGFAVPLRRGGAVTAGVGIYLPLYRYEKLKPEDLLTPLRAAARQIETNLGEA